MTGHLQRGIAIITHDLKGDMTELEDHLSTDYSFEEWAILEEAEREDRCAIETSGPGGECIGIVRVFYAYDVAWHLAWVRAAASERHGSQVTIHLEQEDVTEAEYAAAQVADDFKSPYWKKD